MMDLKNSKKKRSILLCLLSTREIRFLFVCFLVLLANIFLDHFFLLKLNSYGGNLAFKFKYTNPEGDEDLNFQNLELR
jgi:hypothetical protein